MNKGHEDAGNSNDIKPEDLNLEDIVYRMRDPSIEIVPLTDQKTVDSARVCN